MIAAFTTLLCVAFLQHSAEGSATPFGGIAQGLFGIPKNLFTETTSFIPKMTNAGGETISGLSTTTGNLGTFAETELDRNLKNLNSLIKTGVAGPFAIAKGGGDGLATLVKSLGPAVSSIGTGAVTTADQGVAKATQTVETQTQKVTEEVKKVAGI